MNKSPQTVLVTELAKPHPERLLLLGGAWFAMMCFGVFGTTTLVNPNAKLPIIDPLLALLTDKPETSEAQLDASLVTAVGERISQIVTPEPKPEPAAINEIASEPQVPADNVNEEPGAIATPTIPAESTSTKLVPAPAPVQPSPDDASVPFWVYAAIIISCASGSFLITYMLYKATQPKQRQKATIMPSRSSKKGMASPKHPREIGAKSAVVAKISAPSQTSTITIPKPEPVPEIAPLRISTPTKIAPPQLHLEPVTDPEPAPRKLSRAEQLAAIANQAKQQPKKSLVDLVDIRRKGPLAQFP
ncbi:MAG: hypothetical protein HC799_10815 [Limnothrix sp. RL_2_0]|nr:hypothetical protein [Limnothrix sp. RL_2_0]